MDREILFRGKRKDNGKWIEGYLFDDGFANSNRMFIGGFVIEDYKGAADDNYSITGTDFYEIDHSTICQYTGLNDRNGRKIFEGDILKSGLNKIGKIVYNQSHMAFLILEDKENKYYFIRECDGNHIEVIGNIFNNPDLRNDC